MLAYRHRHNDTYRHRHRPNKRNLDKKSKFIALITAGAIATAGLAPTTASADQNRDMIGALIGFAALVALVDAANKNKQPATVTRNKTTRNPVYQDDRNNRHRKNKHNGYRNNHRSTHAALPTQCERARQTHQGWVSFYGKRCMSNFGWVLSNRGWVKQRHANW